MDVNDDIAKKEETEITSIEKYNGRGRQAAPTTNELHPKYSIFVFIFNINKKSLKTRFRDLHYLF